MESLFSRSCFKIRTMEKISTTSVDVSKMCRLCLSSGSTTKDLFTFSSRFEDIVANVIMKCAPVQIRNGDEMPNFICQKCYTRLEETYQFQMQIIQSDRTLHRHLEQVHGLDKKPKFESSIQRPLEDPLIDNTTADNADKCVSSELHDLIDINIDMFVKCEMKDEQDNSRISPDSADDLIEASSTSGEKSLIGDSKLVEDLNVNRKVEESANFNSPCKSIEEIFLKSEIKEEPMDDASLIEFTDDPVNDFSNGASEIRCEDSKVGFDQNLEISATFRSSDVGEYFENIGERIKNIPMDLEKHKRTTKVKSPQFKIIDTRKNQCDICKKCFPYTAILNRHKLMHTGEKPFQCDTCKKCFSQLAHLNTHNLIHTGEKPYQCDVCKKCFTHSGTLNRHKLHHTGEKPYQCDICKKGFTQLRHLNTHKLIHTGEKPYQCDICKKCFTQSGTLSNHKLSHTGEKPYQCDICKKYFNHPGTLYTHKRIHTGEKPYQCDICKKCFARSDYLKSHKRIHTDEKQC